MKADACKSCGKAIVWAANDKTGKAAPIDAPPDPAGPIVLLPGGQYHVLTKAERNAPPVLLGATTYTNHWQTCPDREAWKGVYSR